MLIIDALQYSNWSRPIFRQMRAGGLDCVHVTIAYHESCAETLRNIGAWNRLAQENADLIALAGSAAEIRAAVKAGKTAVLFGFQNCSPVEDDPALVEIFHQLGVRFMQLSYNHQTLLATGCMEANDPGITAFGKRIIGEMNRVGMLVDMSHSAERSTLTAIDHSTRPIVISHANPHAFHPAPRNKSSAVLSALAQSGGMLGFSLYPHHLAGGGACTLREFCDMVGRTAEQIGVDHLGIGSDLCQSQPDSVLTWMRQGRRVAATTATAAPVWPAQPKWFANPTHYKNLVKGLAQTGFTQTEIAKIMGGNWLAFFAKSFGAA